MAKAKKQSVATTEPDVMPAPAPAPIQPEPELPWLDCDGTVLLEGDVATVLQEVSKRLSGKQVRLVVGQERAQKSVEVELVTPDEHGSSRVLLSYLRRLPVLGESVGPEVAVSMEAWDLLERIVRDGTNTINDTVVHKAELAELSAVGLIEYVNTVEVTWGPTAAGLAAAKDDSPLPRTPHDDMRDAHKVGLRLVPLASIVVTTNTRKVFDEAALAELAESVRAHGILQPIVLRPHSEAGKYELVAGGRRYRAAQMAELAEVPATVRHLTDREFLEVQLLENLQRVDVRPADEAEAFAKLLQHGFPLEEIAAKVGKPARFVAERARLMELAPEWVEALQQGRLLIGSAQLLARLTRTQQADAHLGLKRSWGELVDVAGTMLPVYGAAEIRKHLDTQFKTHDLEKVAFPKDDAVLYPKAGACVTCPKRTGNTLYLFDELGGNTCLDGACFAEKSARYVAQVAAEIGASGQPVLKVANHWGRVPGDVLNLNKYKSVESFRDNEMTELRLQGRVRPALMTEGAQAGQVVEVVLDAAVASKPDVVAAIKQQRQAETDKEKAEAAKVRALGAARRQAYYQLATDARGEGKYAAVLLRRMLLGDLQYGRHKQVREMLQQVYGWGELSTRTYMDEAETGQVAGYLAAMDTPALQALLLDLQLVTWLYEEHPRHIPALCKQLGWSDEELLAAHAERKKGQKQEVPA